MNISRPKCLIGAVEETCPSQIASRVRKMAFDFLNELFDRFSFGILPDGTLASDAGESVLFGEFPQRLFCDVDQGSDDGHPVIAHGDFGQVGGELGLMEEIQQESLGAVVSMMAEGDG